jgi:DNA-directed RNA polymerase specialized sigma24 family protein
MGKLRAAGARGIDPDDITSSVLRRVDVAMLRGVLRMQSEAEFWGYVLTIADNLTIKRLAASGRKHSRHDRADGVSQAFAERSSSCGLESRPEEHLRELLHSLESDGDRELVLWRLRGAGYAAIASATDSSQTALRQRWSKIRAYLRSRAASEPGWSARSPRGAAR